MRKLTLKQSKWVEETVNTLNPTEAARKAYNAKNSDVAKSIASENLAKPYLREAIEARLQDIGVTDEYLLKEHKKIIEQDENLSAKNTAIDMMYKIKGTYAAEKTANINFDFPSNPAEIDAKINELLEQLEVIRELE